MAISRFTANYRRATRLAEIATALLPARGLWRERLMRDVPQARSGRPIWWHAASVGELTSAFALIDELRSAHPIIVTTNSATGKALAQAQGYDAHLAPLDFPGVVERFLNMVNPCLAVTIESELWPNRVTALRHRAIPQALLGARLSQKSADRWAKLPGLIRPTLGTFDAVSAQDAASEARLVDLGVRPQSLLPRAQLKLMAPARAAPPAPSAARDRCILAASTHPGEEEAVLDAFTELLRSHPDSRLILAPRHPHRGDAIATLIAARGFEVARRSAHNAPPPAAMPPVYLADTLGEMDLWYDAAAICITGGSFGDFGGHTPWEPAGHGCAILHGPYIKNFAEDYAALQAAGGCRLLHGGHLGSALRELRSDAEGARAMGQKARACLETRAGDPAPLVDALKALIA